MEKILDRYKKRLGFIRDDVRERYFFRRKNPTVYFTPKFGCDVKELTDDQLNIVILSYLRENKLDDLSVEEMYYRSTIIRIHLLEIDYRINHGKHIGKI